MTERKTLTAAQILAIDDLKREWVHVPEWDCDVLVQGLTGAQRDAYEASILIGKGANQTINAVNARAKLVVRCAINEDGSPLFTAAQVGDLGKKNAAALQRVFDACRKLSGLSDDDLDELTEAFEPAQNGASASA